MKPGNDLTVAGLLLFARSRQLFERLLTMARLDF